MNTKPVNFKQVGILPLLKSTNATNFIYEIENPAIKNSIHKEGALIKFSDIESNLFKNNLILVDSLLPQILGEIILYSYKNNEYRLPYLLNEIEQKNPLQISGFKNIKFYTHKVRELLNHLVLGMESSIVWNGTPNIYEHYPIIRNHNEVIYYTDNQNIFIDTVIQNTVITPLNSYNNEFKKLYSDDGKWYLKLNLQLCYEE